MPSLKQLTTDLEFIRSFKLITQAYEEISTMKMKRVRESVVAAREFLEHLADVYIDVKNSYKIRVANLLAHRGKKEKKELARLSAFQKNNKSILVFVSANTKLYGDIINRVFDEFREAVRTTDADIMIVGRLGRELFEDARLGKKYLYFEIPDIDLRSEDLKQIVFHLVQYDAISVFHGRFENIVTQNPYVATISGDPFFNKESVSGHAAQHFLFEPSLEQILGFFEAQVFTLLFEQSVFEGALARFASRIKTMEQALEQIEQKENALVRAGNRARSHQNQKKQAGRLAGMSLWKK